MCIEPETVGEIPGEKSPPFDYTVVESVSLLEDRLFIMVGGTLSTAPKREGVGKHDSPAKVDAYQIIIASTLVC